MSKKNICIYIDDGVKENISRTLGRVANTITNPHLTEDGTGKTQKSLYHCLYRNDDGTPTIVKSFFRVTRNGAEEYIVEVLNEYNSEGFLNLKRKADEILAKMKAEKENEKCH